MVGTVRIHEAEKGVGGVLAYLLVSHRRVGLCKPELIALLSVLPATTDVIFFLLTINPKTLHCSNDWEELESVELHGQTHIKMKANLQAFGIVSNPLQGLDHPK